MNGNGPGDLRHTLITIAIRDYPPADPDFPTSAEERFAADMDRQVADVSAWWSTSGAGFDVQDAKEITCRRDMEEFVHRCGLHTLSDRDVVVLYVTGHGVAGPSGRHYLRLPQGRRGRLLDGYPTAELVTAVLNSDAPHVLIVVNTCYAGALHDELARLLKDLPPERRTLPTLGVFTSAAFDEAPGSATSPRCCGGPTTGCAPSPASTATGSHLRSSCRSCRSPQSRTRYGCTSRPSCGPRPTAAGRARACPTRGTRRIRHW
ncbi:hypothetical protein AB0K60_34900 [Thermopolyspora sp. NPDC052614]|uniref:hypothetical protein n=1 Tax=Thermopolyspora sp. NPDC052614 TaxID=3155682 RepID=UPI00341FFD70